MFFSTHTPPVCESQIMHHLHFQTLNTPIRQIIYYVFSHNTPNGTTIHTHTLQPHTVPPTLYPYYITHTINSKFIQLSFPSFLPLLPSLHFPFSSAYHKHPHSTWKTFYIWNFRNLFQLHGNIKPNPGPLCSIMTSCEQH